MLALPTSAALSLDDLIAARARPAHPLGVVTRPTPSDGQLLGPAEFFCHDLDHARFKVREDLLARGLPIPDAYQPDSTFDVNTGGHRSILPARRRPMSLPLLDVKAAPPGPRAPRAAAAGRGVRHR